MAGSFPTTRLRRLRMQSWLRDLVQEHRLSSADLIWPVFVREGSGLCEPISAMPGVCRYSIDTLVPQVQRVAQLGIPAVALFPVIETHLKDERGSESANASNLLCRALTALKQACPDMGLIADVALDPYTTHGHDGLLVNGRVHNDQTLEALKAQALVQARAGADIIAPSDMMDGRVAAIRTVLDEAGYQDIAMLSYAAKYASCFYGPFRDAVGSAQALGKADKRCYQMNPANGGEALREVALDIAEGADMVMVKPGMPYLDIVQQVKQRFAVPTFAYQVSGEYAMLRNAADQGQLDWQASMLESLLCFKRAGADAVLTYAAPEIAAWLA